MQGPEVGVRSSGDQEGGQCGWSGVRAEEDGMGCGQVTACRIKGKADLGLARSVGSGTAEKGSDLRYVLETELGFPAAQMWGMREGKESSQVE